MHLGRRLHDVDAPSFEEALAKVQAQGFHSIQLAPTKSLNFTRDMLSPGYGRYLRQALDSHALDVAILGSYFDLSDRGPSREETLNRYKDHLLLAHYADFKVVGTETGKIMPDDSQYEEAFQAVKENLGVILDQAEKLGIVVAIEPVYGHTIYNREKMEKLLEAYPGRNLQVIYDPVNLLDPTDEAGAPAMWKDFLEHLGNRLAAVHVKDYVIEDGKKRDLPAGTGRMDYSHLFNLAQKKPYLDFLIEAAKDENISSIMENFGG
jgi:L-ribulose-5-phosphate 3-epimerase